MPYFNFKRGDITSQVLGDTPASDVPPDATYSKSTIFIFVGTAIFFVVALFLIAWMVVSSFS